MAQIRTLTLRVQDVAAQRRFYCDVLGMSDLGDGRVGYGGAQAALRFLPAAHPYDPQPDDLYWKIALSVPDIELARTQLTRAGVPCSTARQFRDVGYLAQATDPEGFSIELLDHHFQGQRPDGWPVDPDRLGGGAHLSLVTLRWGDIGEIAPQIAALGLVPLSVQPVLPYGFTLYFYADTDEQPPNPDLTALDNRSWVYQRPYTVLEIQSVKGLTTPRRPHMAQAGYAGLSLDDGALPDLGLGSDPDRDAT